MRVAWPMPYCRESGERHELRKQVSVLAAPVAPSLPALNSTVKTYRPPHQLLRQLLQQWQRQHKPH